MERAEPIEVITNVRIGGEGRDLLSHPEAERDGVYDVWLADGTIADIAPAGAIRRRGRVLYGDGGWLIPGLWDHHVHLAQWALARTRPSVLSATAATQAAQLAADAPVTGGIRVLLGMRDGLWPDEPTAAVLDERCGEVPTYLFNADLHSIWLNTAAARREGLAVGGLIREETAFEVGRRLNNPGEDVLDRLCDEALREASGRGVVGMWDLELSGAVDRWRRRIARGGTGIRAAVNVYPDELERAIAGGFVTGEAIDDCPLVRYGMLKVICDGSLGTRTAATSAAYPDGGHGALAVDADEMIRLVEHAASVGILTTLHAIGDATAARALDAFAAVDVPGRIEHAQLVAHSDLPRFARLGVEASVQPEHAIDDRDLCDTAWAGQTALAYPLRSLHDAGANLLFGSDAPVAALDPWRGIAAAVSRTDGSRDPWRGEDALDARTALAASTQGGSASPAVIAPGAVADLVIVAEDPWKASAAALRTMTVQATVVDARPC